MVSPVKITLNEVTGEASATCRVEYGGKTYDARISMGSSVGMTSEEVQSKAEAFFGDASNQLVLKGLFSYVPERGKLTYNGDTGELRRWENNRSTVVQDHSIQQCFSIFLKSIKLGEDDEDDVLLDLGKVGYNDPPELINNNNNDDEDIPPPPDDDLPPPPTDEDDSSPVENLNNNNNDLVIEDDSDDFTGYSSDGSENVK